MSVFSEQVLPLDYNGKSGELRTVITNSATTTTRIQLIWVPKEELSATELNPIHHTALYEINYTNVSRILGTRSRGWGQVQSFMERNLIIPDADYISYCQFDLYEMQVFATKIVEAADILWPTCEECGFHFNGQQPTEHAHIECEECQALIREEDALIYEYESDLGQTTNTLSLCLNCYRSPDREMGPCWLCSTNVAFDSSHRLSIQNEGERVVCLSCYDEYGVSCDACGYSVSSDTFIEEVDMCEACARSQGLLGIINDWDYRPPLEFHPPMPVDPMKPLYIGMEIETSFNDWYDDGRTKYMTWIGALPEDLIYVKSDSSVTNGFEIVTHPMQPRWALDNFPFQMFDDLVAMGARPTHSSCGTHIHMNKDSLSQAHLWKVLQIHFRLPEFCKLVGGREDGTFHSFGNPDMAVQRKNIIKIVKNKDKEINDYDRYVAVNLRNEYTIELRYMRGGTTSKEIKKNIEWALAIYEFTDFLEIGDINGGALTNPGYFLWWIQKGDYPNLQEWISERNITELPITRETN